MNPSELPGPARHVPPAAAPVGSAAQVLGAVVGLGALLILYPGVGVSAREAVVPAGGSAPVTDRS